MTPNQPPKPGKPDLKKATPTKSDRDAKVPAAKGPIHKGHPPTPKKGGGGSAPAAPAIGHVFAAPPLPQPGGPPPVTAGNPVQTAPPADMQQQYGRLDGKALARAILGAFASQIAQPGVKP